MKNINETRNCFFEEIEQNELISRKHKKLCTALNYIDHFLILASTITVCISISAFASLIDIPIGIEFCNRLKFKMLSYCLCRKNSESKNAKVARTKNGKIMLLSKCAVCEVKYQNISNRKKLVNY